MALEPMRATGAPQLEADSSPRTLLSRIPRRGLGPTADKALIGLVVLIVWEVGTVILQVNPLLFPRASVVATEFIEGLGDGTLVQYGWFTIRLLFLSQVIGAVLALCFTGLATTSRIAREVMEFFTAVLNPLPSIALLPLAMIWFGLSLNSLVFVTANATLWPMAVSFMMGLSSTPRTIYMFGQNLGLSRLKLMWFILLPSAIPHLITGLKVGWAFGWRTIVAAELVFGTVGGSGGLGWYINQSRFNLDTANVMAALIAIIFVGLITDALFRLLERRTVVRWGMVQGGASE